MVCGRIREIKGMMVVSAVAIFLFAAFTGCRVKLDRGSVEARAREIHSRVLTVDTHCDTAFNLLRKGWRMVGLDYVGIGTDFDGGGGVIGCDDVSGMVHVTEEFIRRGYSEKDIAKIWGGNFMRVFRKAIEVSGRLSTK